MLPSLYNRWNKVFWAGKPRLTWHITKSHGRLYQRFSVQRILSVHDLIIGPAYLDGKLVDYDKQPPRVRDLGQPHAR